MLFLRLKRGQNPINNLTLNSRPIHPNPNPPKIFRPKLFNNALESIMPCRTSSEFKCNPSCNEINLIMKHQNRRCWNFKKPRQRSNTFSRKIHIRLPSSQQKSAPPYTYFHNSRLTKRNIDSTNLKNEIRYYASFFHILVRDFRVQRSTSSVFLRENKSSS